VGLWSGDQRGQTRVGRQEKEIGKKEDGKREKKIKWKRREI